MAQNIAFKVSDCVPGVKAKLANRDDIDNDIPRWIRAAVLELGNKFEFDALRVLGPFFTLTPTIAEYALDNWAVDGDEIDDIVALKLFFAGNSGPGFVLKQRGIRVVEQLAMTNGMPVYYNRTSKMNLMVAQAPVQLYTTQMRYQKVHPFNPDPTQWINDFVYFPSDWQLAIEYAAAVIGASEKRWADMVQLNFQLLYGSPGEKGKSPTPGVIANLIPLQQKDQSHNEHQLNVIVDTYGR